MAAAVVVGGVAAAAILYAVNPAVTGVFAPCPLHHVTGLHCPGCGSLRAMHQLLHGNLRTALALNPLMVLSIPALGLLVLRPAWLKRRWVPWVALAILLAYAVARNLPWWPFTLLAPG